MASVPYYLLAGLVLPPLAATAAGAAALIGEISVQSQRRTTPGQIAAEVGRRMVLVLLAALMAQGAGTAGRHPLPLLQPHSCWALGISPASHCCWYRPDSGHSFTSRRRRRGKH